MPLWHEQWEPVWKAGAETRVPIHLHSIGAPLDPRWQDAGPRIFRYVAATKTTVFQVGMMEVLAEVMWQ